MNNLKTDINGGFPFTLDDLRFVNAAQMEAFVGVVKALIGNLPYARLQGCEYSVNPDSTWHINEGYLYFNNEIFYAPAQDLASQTTGGYFWDVNITYDHSGDKAFLIDGVVHLTYEVRRAKLNYYIAGTEGTRPPMQADNTVTILKNRLGIDSSPQWTEVAFSSSNVSISTSGTISAISGSLYYKVIGKTVFIRISLNLTIDTGDANTETINIALPAGIVPKGPSEPISTIAFDNDSTTASVTRIFQLYAYYLSTDLSLAMIQKVNFELRSFQFQGEIFYEIA